MRPDSTRRYGAGCQNDRRVFLVSAVIVIVSVATAWTCDASQLFGRRDHTSSVAAVSPVPILKRKIQSWLIRNGSESRISATTRQRIKQSMTKNDINRNKQRGSFMTSQYPTEERLYRWFRVEGEDPNQFMRCMMLRNEFNHIMVGITNPFLKILTSSKPQQEQHAPDDADSSIFCKLDNNNRRILRPLSQVGDGNCERKTRRDEKSVLTARTNTLFATITLGSSKNVENLWWPSLQISQNSDTKQYGSKTTTDKFKKFQGKNKISLGSGAQNWRILTYRKRVGRGRDCYKKVRDAALDWEFQSADGSMGMMKVPENCPSENNSELETMPVASSNIKRSYFVQPIDVNESDLTRSANVYSSSSSLYRSLGSRRLVSFSSKSITGFLPSFLQRRIYSINPVMVVYDVVDQRAPDGQTTFTSTAYATLKGHFLCGEERVTVVLRDGSQDVEVEIFSISRAGSGLLGKTLWPFIGKMQSNFFQQQLHHLSQSRLTIDVENPIKTDADKNSKFFEGNYLLRT